MPISKNNTNITAVEFNGKPVATVVHIDQITKKETIVFGGILQAPVVNLPYAKTYNTLTFVVKNNDYRQIDKLVVTASATGYPTRIKEYDSIPGFTSTTVYMGSGENQFLNSGVEYTLSAYAKLEDKQSDTSNTIKSTTISELTTFPEIENSIDSNWNYTVYKVINKENGPVTINTWIEDPISGYKVNNTEQSYRIENKDGYKYFTAYFGLANEEKVYGAIANAINEDGKKTSSNASRAFTKPQQEYTEIPTIQNYSYTANTVSVTLFNEDESTAELKCRLRNTSNNDIIYPTNDGAGGTFQNLTASGGTYTFNFTVSSATTYIIERTAISLNLDAPELQPDYQTGSIFTTKCVVLWYYFNGSRVVQGDRDEVEYNTNITTSYYSGSTPSRTGYTFDRWDVSEFLYYPYTLNIKENKSIFALFNINQYNITWYNTKSGSSIKSKSYDYGTVIAAYTNGVEPTYPQNPADISTGDGKFYFSSWSKTPSHIVDSNLTINTNWTPYNYAIWYMGLSGYYNQEHYRAQFKAGEAITYPTTNPSDPSNSNYRFTGWNPSSAVMPSAGSDKLIYGTWVKRYYVKWYDGSSSTPYKQGLYDNGYQVISSDYPTDAAINKSLDSVKKYITGWDKTANTTATKVNGADLSITATIANWPKAKWWNGYAYKDDDPELGKLFIKQESYFPGNVITGYPDALTRTGGWVWNGWDPPLVYASGVAVSPTIGTSDKEIEGKWIKQYTITWDNYSNDTTSIVNAGTIPTAPAHDYWEGHTPNGWSPSIVAASANVTYIAQYTQLTTPEPFYDSVTAGNRYVYWRIKNNNTYTISISTKVDHPEYPIFDYPTKTTDIAPGEYSNFSQLVDNDNYTYYIRANATGTGRSKSSPDTVRSTTTNKAAPSKPTFTSVVSYPTTSYNQIKITFTAGSGSDSMYYKITSSSAGYGPYEGTMDTTSPNTIGSISAQNKTTGTTYTVEIRSRNVSSNGTVKTSDSVSKLVIVKGVPI